tara:strand:+ start:569 stop:685 length:117 start_codon:yes stop_codon:yes gene_type:complete
MNHTEQIIKNDEGFFGNEVMIGVGSGNIHGAGGGISRG